MADRLIFPVGFDFDSALSKAQGDADRLLRQLETMIKSRPLAVNLNIPNAGTGSINEINTRIAELAKEWNQLTEAERIHNKVSGEFTPRAQAILKEFTKLTGATESYARSLNQLYAASRKAAGEQERNVEKERKRQAILKAAETSIKNLEAKLKLYNQQLKASDVGSTQFNKAAAEVKRLTEELDKARKKARELTATEAQSARERERMTKQLSQEYRNQESYVSRLIKRLTVYASFSTLGAFLTNVREVTAQFELQRVSLGAIIQDQTKANALFSQIKQFALKSPIKILDLTKYTKQVAAYRIETDKLFDTTKRLADVATGLGVDMGRIVLAYGQVKAASYLRAAEVRQFTEAGIPMLELLSEKLTKLNGEMVSTEQVMQMISKRGIDFKMVEEVFNDMTEAGGMFYNIQEKQGNTLYGMWAKLGDAASIMYSEIGQTDDVSAAMKWTIEKLTDLMRNWKSVGWTIATVGGTVTAFTWIIKALNAHTIANTMTVEKNTAAHIASRQAIIRKSTSLRVMNALMIKCGMSTNMATAYTLAFSRAIKLVSFAVTGFLVGALAILVEKLLFTKSTAEKVREALDEIDAESAAEQMKSVRNFESLAKTAVQAADGSKKQRDALEELSRTYGKIIPQEQLSIENLRKLKGNYDSLTQSIKQYVAEQMKQKKIDTIISETGVEMTKQEKKFIKAMEGTWNYEQVQRFLEAYKQEMEKFRELSKAGRGQEYQGSIMENALKSINAGISDITRAGSDATESLTKFGKAFSEQLVKIDAVSSVWERGSEALGKYGSTYEAAVKQIEENPIKLGGNVLSPDDDGFMFNAQKANLEIKDAMIPTLKKVLADIGIAWQEGWANILDEVDVSNKQMVSAIDFTAIIEKTQAEYDRLAEQTTTNLEFIKRQHSSYIEQIRNARKAGDDEELKRLLKLKDYSERLITQLSTQLEGYTVSLNAINKIQEKYKQLVPDNETVAQLQHSFRTISKTLGIELGKVSQHMIGNSETVDAYKKRLKSQIDEVKNRVKVLSQTVKVFGSTVNLLDKTQAAIYDKMKADLEQEEKKLSQLEQTYKVVLTYLPDENKKKSGGTKQDPRLQNLKEEISLVQKLYSEYKQLEQQEGMTKAAEDMRKLAAATIDMFSEKYRFGLPVNVDDLTSALEILYKEMEKLPEKKFTTLKKDLKELRWTIEKVNIDESQKNIEKQMKILADRISRGKTAKEFFDKILSQTGNLELAANVSLSIYGEDGYGLREQIADQIRTYFTNANITVPLDIIGTDNSVNYKRLGEFAERMKQELGEKPYNEIKKIAEEGQKDLAKVYEGYFKDLEKAEDYASKRVKLARTTADKIAAIRADEAAGIIDAKTSRSLIDGMIDKELKEAARLEWEAFKDTSLYVQMFSDLEHATSSTLKMMKDRLTALSDTWGSALDPTQLKELQSRMEEIDSQLRERNPWKSLRESYLVYRKAISDVSGDGAVMNAARAAEQYDNAVRSYGKDSAQARSAYIELEARRGILKLMRSITDENGKQLNGQKALNAAQQKAFDNEKIARGQVELAAAELNDAIARAKAAKQDPAKDPAVKSAQMQVEATEEQWRIMQLISKLLQDDIKTVEKWKLDMENTASAIAEMLTWSADIARGIADIAEATGASEEDVEYFNSIADALGDITSGIQDIVNAATSGDIMGLVKSVLTAVPKMFIGFVNLFNAGRIRKANKEIKRQQELLDNLEYTYERLENLADKVFGVDYLDNYNKRMEVLNAQAEAYRKQAEAEKSKGKKKDKDRLKEYEDAYRDTMDEIADMKTQFSEQQLGTDLTSAARDFAQAWLDAYREFGNTADAMSEKFDDMINNMVANSLLAKAMQRALEPAFAMIDDMTDEDFYSKDFWAKFMETAQQSAENADAAGQVIMSMLEGWGLDMRGSASDVTGIAKGVASASSEEVNANTAALNVQNYYMSHMPEIAQNVAAIRMFIEQGGVVSSDGVDYADMWNQHLALQQGIHTHTAETVAECRRIAEQCTAMATDIHRVIVPRGSDRGFGMQVYMK